MGARVPQVKMTRDEFLERFALVGSAPFEGRGPHRATDRHTSGREVLIHLLGAENPRERELATRVSELSGGLVRGFGVQLPSDSTDPNLTLVAGFSTDILTQDPGRLQRKEFHRDFLRVRVYDLRSALALVAPNEPVFLSLEGWLESIPTGREILQGLGGGAPPAAVSSVPVHPQPPTSAPVDRGAATLVLAPGVPPVARPVAPAVPPQAPAAAQGAGKQPGDFTRAFGMPAPTPAAVAPPVVAPPVVAPPVVAPPVVTPPVVTPPVVTPSFAPRGAAPPPSPPPVATPRPAAPGAFTQLFGGPPVSKPAPDPVKAPDLAAPKIEFEPRRPDPAPRPPAAAPAPAQPPGEFTRFFGLGAVAQAADARMKAQQPAPPPSTPALTVPQVPQIPQMPPIPLAQQAPLFAQAPQAPQMPPVRQAPPVPQEPRAPQMPPVQQVPQAPPTPQVPQVPLASQVQVPGLGAFAPRFQIPSAAEPTNAPAGQPEPRVPPPPRSPSPFTQVIQGGFIPASVRPAAPPPRLPQAAPAPSAPPVAAAPAEQPDEPAPKRQLIPLMLALSLAAVVTLALILAFVLLR